jgi:DNA-binding response OmpR family regulator
MKVLIIDDEPHIRQMMRLTLEASGYDVDEAGSGEECLATFGAGRAYDVVILDQKMPGLDGLATLKRMKERTPEACVLMVTAFGSIELAVDAMKLGAADFLRKPMTPETLRGAVAAALGNRRAPFRREPASGVTGKPEIQTLTLNGFQITPAAGSTPARSSNEHQFRVKHFTDGSEVTVTVVVDPEAVGRIRRLTGRDLAPQGAFFRLQAERLLSAHLWSEGKPPDTGRLTVRDVSRDDLDIALAWEAD